MPRRNNQPKPQPKLSKSPNEQRKVRYATQRAAESAIAEAQKYQPELDLRAYQSPTDGGWYLTSR